MDIMDYVWLIALIFLSYFLVFIPVRGWHRIKMKKMREAEIEQAVIYDPSKKRRYEIPSDNGSVIVVEEEDFWINGSRGCYDHGYVDPPVGYVDLKKYQNQDQDFFETKVVEYIDAYGGKGNSKIMSFERELESTRNRITNGVFEAYFFYEGNVMGKIYGKQIEKGLLCFHQVPLSDKSATKKYLLSIGLDTNGEKITEKNFGCYFGSEIQKGG